MTTTPSKTTSTSGAGRAEPEGDVDRSRATASALEALRCEQELLDCRHGERGELLLDAAGNWFEAGHVERAVELFTEARLFGGDAARTAQLHLARIAFHRGDDCEALGTLRGLATAELDPFDLVGGGDLLREHGEPKESIGWYDRVLDGRTPQEAAHPDSPWVVRAALTGRARARADLGLPPDPLDRTAAALPLPTPAPEHGAAEPGGSRWSRPGRTGLDGERLGADEAVLREAS